MSVLRTAAALALAALRPLSPETRAALLGLRRTPLRLSRTDLAAVVRMVDAMEKLPTVRHGMKTLGMRSLLEWGVFASEIRSLPSPFTHPKQRPYFFHPGLSARPFHPRDAFPWIAGLEAAAGDVRQEIDEALAARRGFQPYRPLETGAPVTGWNMLYLHSAGRRVPGNAERFPRTVALLEGIPRFRSLGISCISALNPGAEIEPHAGPINGILRVHLCLRGGAGSTIEVGDEHHDYRDDEAFVLDDSFVHRVRHRGGATRFILFFDVWHPDWEDAEVARLTELHATLSGTGFRRQVEERRERDAELLAGEVFWS